MGGLAWDGQQEGVRREEREIEAADDHDHGPVRDRAAEEDVDLEEVLLEDRVGEAHGKEERREGPGVERHLAAVVGGGRHQRGGDQEGGERAEGDHTHPAPHERRGARHQAGDDHRDDRQRAEPMGRGREQVNGGVGGGRAEHHLVDRGEQRERAIEPEEHAPAVPGQALGREDQRQVEERGREERLGEQVQAYEPVRPIEIRGRGDEQSGGEAGGEEPEARCVPGLQIRDQQAGAEERDAVQQVGAEEQQVVRGRKAPRRHLRHQALALGAPERVLDGGAGRPPAHVLVDRGGRAHALAIDPHHLVLEEARRVAVGPVPECDGRHHPVRHHEEAGEGRVDPVRRVDDDDQQQGARRQRRRHHAAPQQPGAHRARLRASSRTASARTTPASPIQRSPHRT